MAGPVPGEGETITQPALVVDSDATPEQLQLLHDVYDGIRKDPEFAGRFLDAYGRDMDVVDSVIELIGDQPERLPLLRIITRAFQTNADAVTDFDSKTMKRIEKDQMVQSLQARRMGAKGPEAHEAGKALRVRRWRVLTILLGEDAA